MYFGCVCNLSVSVMLVCVSKLYRVKYVVRFIVKYFFYILLNWKRSRHEFEWIEKWIMWFVVVVVWVLIDWYTKKRNKISKPVHTNAKPGVYKYALWLLVCLKVAVCFVCGCCCNCIGVVVVLLIYAVAGETRIGGEKIIMWICVLVGGGGSLLDGVCVWCFVLKNWFGWFLCGCKLGEIDRE